MPCMFHKITRCFIAILIFLFAQVCHAQKKFTTLIRFPESLDANKLHIEYDDGKGVYTVPNPLFKNEVAFSGTFFSKYATLEIRFDKTPMSFHANKYFLKEGNSTLVFLECRRGDTMAYPFDSCKLSNAIEIRKLPESKKMDLFTAKEQLELQEYWNKTTEDPSDSLYKILYVKSDNLFKKQIAFVKQNNDTYYSLWLFRQNFLNPYNVQHHYKLLTKVFTSFPAGLRNSFEGKEILKRMYGGMYAKKGFRAQDFTVKDNSGASIKLSNYKGKYVLLQFWGSRCGPCIDEMPDIKKIRDAYNPDQLEVISFTTDRDSTDFSRAVVKYNMTWHNIFDGGYVCSLYGVNAIPSLYLVNKEGIIVYSRLEDYDGDLKKLNDLLSRLIK